MKFKSEKPRYSGIYLIELQDYGYEVIFLFQCRNSREWYISDYPNSRVTSSIKEYGSIKWGPRIAV